MDGCAGADCTIKMRKNNVKNVVIFARIKTENNIMSMSFTYLIRYVFGSSEKIYDFDKKDFIR